MNKSDLILKLAEKNNLTEKKATQHHAREKPRALMDLAHGLPPFKKLHSLTSLWQPQSQA